MAASGFNFGRAAPGRLAWLMPGLRLFTRYGVPGDAGG
jgi:hypothetical protein